MCAIENKKIILVVYKLTFKEMWIGNALCSYEYYTVQEGIENKLIIDLDIAYPLYKSPIYDKIESEINCVNDSSQAFDSINRYLMSKCYGTEAILCKTIFKFNFKNKCDNTIRLSLVGPNMTPDEITNVKNGKCLTLSDVNEKEAIIIAYENLI